MVMEQATAWEGPVQVAATGVELEAGGSYRLAAG
jgi:hypothetical protein